MCIEAAGLLTPTRLTRIHDRRTNRSDVLDMVVRSGKFRYRIIRRWFAPEQRFVLWLTNLPRDEFSVTDIMLLYRCRWQIELLFKELKSHTNLRKLNTEQKAIVEGLIWTSLLTLLLLKRLIVNSASPELSLFKAAKNTDVWFCPLVTAISQRAMQEVEHYLDWASKIYDETLNHRSKVNPGRAIGYVTFTISLMLKNLAMN